MGDTVRSATSILATIGQSVHLYGGFLPADAIAATMDLPMPSCDVVQYFFVSGAAKPPATASGEIHP